MVVSVSFIEKLMNRLFMLFVVFVVSLWWWWKCLVSCVFVKISVFRYRKFVYCVIVLSMMNDSVGCGNVGLMNWMKNEMKNRIVFGFSRFMISVLWNGCLLFIVCGVLIGVLLCVCSLFYVLCSILVLMYSKYVVLLYLMMENSSGFVFSSDVMFVVDSIISIVLLMNML